MQEDELGTRRTIEPARIFVQCVRCGAMVPRATARIVSADTLSESHSEFEYLCHECHEALAAGETDLPVEN